MSTIELKYSVIDQIIKLTDMDLLDKIINLLKPQNTTDELDPYEISPSGDKYWANPENVKALDKALDMLKDPNNKPVAVLETQEDIRNYINYYSSCKSISKPPLILNPQFPNIQNSHHLSLQAHPCFAKWQCRVQLSLN